MQFARINGVTLHYQTIGTRRAGPALVFVNALGADFRIWRDVIVRLAGEHEILVYDKRGHGLSDIGETPYAPQTHAADLAGLMDHLGLKQAIICGLSIGGQVAQGLFASRPDLVAALVLCDTAPKIGDSDFWNARIARIEKGGMEAILDGVIERWFAPKFRRPGNSDFAGYRNMLARQPAAGYVASCAALRDSDLTPEAPRIDVPTLCVVGEDDSSTPPDLVAAMAALIPGATFKTISGAGHFPCVEQPERLTDALRAFILTLGTEVTSHVTH